MKSTNIIIAVLLVLMLSIIGSALPIAVSAPAVREVVNKELVESQYGTLGDLIGVGDRIFIETYSDGSSQKVFERTTLGLIKPATIISINSGSTTFWQTEGNNVNVNIRVQGVNVPSAKKYIITDANICGWGYAAGTTSGTQIAKTCDTTNHKFEIFDVHGSSAYYYVPSTYPLKAPIPSALNSNPSVLATLVVAGQSAGTIYPTLKEYVELEDGTWMGSATTKSSEYVLTIIWTSATQAGAATPGATPLGSSGIITNPNYTSPTLKSTLVNVIDSKTSNPLEATITSGGQNLGTSPLLITLQSDATKILYVKNTGYNNGVVTLKGTDASPYVVKLEPLSSNGTQQNETDKINIELKDKISNTTNADEIAALQAELERLRSRQPVPTPSTPGFEGIFVLVSILVVTFLVRQQKRGV